jgi:2-polyprenyl-3-methyl-5-hydroxy-6-metoxy-1,4-benzoquinol methylase
MAKAELISRCLSDAIGQYIMYFQKLLEATHETGYKKTNKDYYCFVPSRSSEDVLSCLIEVKKYLNNKIQRALKFLDCGCGIGNIMLLVNTLGGFSSIHGIEYELKTWDIARALLPDNCMVVCDDILHFERYGHYDVIFYFTPIKDLGKRATFREKLAEDVKIGTVIVSYGGSDWFGAHPNFKMIPATFSWAYEKIT